MMLAPLLPGLVTLCCLGDLPQGPPPLTFDEHVDYIAWFNDSLSQGKAENALPLYEGLVAKRRGRGGIRPPTGAAKSQFDRIAPTTIWKAEQYPEYAAYLRQCAPYFEIFRKASQVKDFWQPIPPDTELLLNVHQPLLDSCRLTSRALLMQAWMKQDNQVEKLADAHRTILQDASHWRQAGHFLGGLVSTASRARVYGSILSALHQGIIDGQAARGTYEALRDHDPGAFDWAAVLNTEWAVQLDALQFIYTDGRLNNERWNRFRRILSDVSSRKDPPFNPEADPGATIALIDQHFEKMHRILKGSPAATRRRQLADYYGEIASIHQNNPWIRIMVPEFTRAYELTVRAEARRRGTLLVLAIHAHHAKHDQWPESLRKIDKKLGLKGLRRLRKDPFSGKNFKYKIKDSQPLLYSVGDDGKDDEGRHDPKWGEGKQGGDFVFWPHQP